MVYLMKITVYYLVLLAPLYHVTILANIKRVTLQLKVCLLKEHTKEICRWLLMF